MGAENNHMATLVKRHGDGAFHFGDNGGVHDVGVQVLGGTVHADLAQLLQSSSALGEVPANGVGEHGLSVDGVSGVEIHELLDRRIRSRANRNRQIFQHL